MVLSEELVMSFLVPVADSLHWLFPLGEPVASSIQGTVLVLGRPGDILRAAAGGMPCYRQAASTDRMQTHRGSGCHGWDMPASDS